MPSVNPQPAVKLTPEVIAAASNSLVLTPNERLRRAVTMAWAELAHASGRRAWPGARVATVNGFLAECYARLRTVDPSLPRLLAGESELLIFAQLAPEGARGLAPLALEAWNLAHQWEIELDADNLSETENGRLLLSWTQRVGAYLQEHGLTTRAQLPRLLRHSSRPERLLCLAFEHTPSAMTRLLEDFAQRGTALSHTPAEPVKLAVLERLEFTTLAEELAAAAQWASTTAKGDASARIGVVVPDLGQRHLQVARQFNAYFAPLGQSIEAFDIAGGVALVGQPIWVAAHDWLCLCVTTLAASRLPQLLASRYLDLPESLGAAAGVTALPPNLTLAQLSAVLPRADLADIVALVPQVRTASMGDWVVAFGQLLDRVRWTGRNAGTVQFQAWQQARTLLDKLTHGPGSTWRCTANQALEAVQATLAAKLFAPLRPAARVQVLGYLETTGLAFTHLWITGLSDTAWPGQVSVNPLIPITAQRRAGVPRIDSSAEHAFAVDRMAHWRCSTRVLRVSHAVDDGEARHQPSRLTLDIPLVKSPKNAMLLRSHPYFYKRSVELQIDGNPQGTRLLPGPLHGGTRLLRDQALCPFRAWAIHRLGLAEIRVPHSFPDALERGVMVHEALYQLYGGADAESLVQSRADNLGGPPSTSIDSADIDRAVDRALAAHYRRFPDAFLATERIRVRALLEGWLEFEATREAFEIHALEVGAEVTLQGLTLRVRLDRVDDVAGARVIIDYKTGSANVGRLLADRLIEPQLPVYAVTDPTVSGVLFAQIHAEAPRLIGLVAETLEFDARRIKSYSKDAWLALTSEWKHKLAGLASEYREGFAAVAPADDSACSNCHLTGFCRIQARSIQPEDPSP